MTRDMDKIKKVYTDFKDKVSRARHTLGRPLTYAEKILYAHLDQEANSELKRKQDYAYLNPDRVAMQDATAQMALLQLMNSGKDRTEVPSTVHCDHLIQALHGAKEDLARANEVNREVYDFLKSVSARYGIGYWQPGSGIIHQVVLENYAFPGGMMIGTDSHTPNMGGMGMIAIGVGGADAVDVMVGMPWEVKWPGIIGVRLTGALQGWASSKDVICKLLGILTVKGGTGHIVEFFGPGCKTMTTTEKSAITDMGAEHGATTSIFPVDTHHLDYLTSTGRSDLAQLVEKMIDEFQADQDVLDHPEKYFDRVIELDLSTLIPHLNGPFSPDKVWTVETIKDGVKTEGYTDQISASCLGSCNNSSYDDLKKSAAIARDLMDQGIKATTEFLVTPGSDMVRATTERDGILDTLKEFGATILANACGPCIGQWSRPNLAQGTKNTIVNSFNRNFKKRNDGNPSTEAFVTSPEMCTIYAAAGRLSFNPLTDTLTNAQGQQVKLKVPSVKPAQVAYAQPDISIIEPPADGSSINVIIDPKSDRLQKLAPFPAWDGKDLDHLPLLFKARGKCTTDHISPAGPWLKFRGHLDNISNNMLIGGVSAFHDRTGEALNQLTGQYQEVPKVAREYKAQGKQWIIVGDENYGEGSSREHAAMEPRHLGCIAVLTRSFARIHETNLKKQGILALNFADPADYEKIQEWDTISILNLKEQLQPGRNIQLTLHHKDGSTEQIMCKHSFGLPQIEWFKAGSALNLIAAANKKKD